MRHFIQDSKVEFYFEHAPSDGQASDQTLRRACVGGRGDFGAKNPKAGRQWTILRAIFSQMIYTGIGFLGAVCIFLPLLLIPPTSQMNGHIVSKVVFPFYRFGYSC